MKSSQLYGDIRKIKCSDEKYSESTYLHIQSQHWGGDSQLPKEGAALDYLKNDNFFIEVNP